MDHYRIEAVFDDFFQYLKSKMQPKDRHKLCIMHKPVEEKQTIYISTVDPELKEIISSNYDMIECDSPYNIYKEDESEWYLRGNQNFIEPTA